MSVRPIFIPIGPSIGYVALTQGQHALIDAEDAERVGAHNWYAQWKDGIRGFYAVRSVRKPRNKVVRLYLHRFILGSNPGLSADHINTNGLDNRRSNLRRATTSQNNRNQRLRRNNRSGYKGVVARGAKYLAEIRVNGKYIYLGYHATAEAAHAAYCEAATRYHGEFARVA